MILQCQRMGDKLEAVVQRTVRLDVQVVGVAVCDLQKSVCVRSVFSALVDLQLYAEPTQAFAMEDQLRNIVVLMDRTTVAGIIIAVTAEVFVVVLVNMIVVNQRAAMVTAGVVALTAVMAERI